MHIWTYEHTNASILGQSIVYGITTTKARCSLRVARILLSFHMLQSLCVCAIDSIMLNLELTLNFLSTFIMFIVPMELATTTTIEYSNMETLFPSVLRYCRESYSKKCTKMDLFHHEISFVCIKVHKANNNFCSSHVKWIMSSWFRVTTLWRAYTNTHVHRPHTSNNIHDNIYFWYYSRFVHCFT